MILWVYRKGKHYLHAKIFLLAVGKSLEKYTFLKSGLLEIRDLGVKSVVKVFIIVSTLNDEVKNYLWIGNFKTSWIYVFE